MMTTKNALTAAYSELLESQKFGDSSAAAYVHAVEALHWAAVAVGTCQRLPFDYNGAAEAAKLVELAKERLQVCVRAQIDLEEALDGFALEAYMEYQEASEGR